MESRTDPVRRARFTAAGDSLVDPDDDIEVSWLNIDGYDPRDRIWLRWGLHEWIVVVERETILDPATTELRTVYRLIDDADATAGLRQLVAEAVLVRACDDPTVSDVTRQCFLMHHRLVDISAFPYDPADPLRRRANLLAIDHAPLRYDPATRTVRTSDGSAVLEPRSGYGGPDFPGARAVVHWKGRAIPVSYIRGITQELDPETGVRFERLVLDQFGTRGGTPADEAIAPPTRGGERLTAPLPDEVADVCELREARSLAIEAVLVAHSELPTENRMRTRPGRWWTLAGFGYRAPAGG